MGEINIFARDLRTLVFEFYTSILGPRGEVRTLPGGVAAICNPAEWEAYRLYLSTTYPIIILQPNAGSDD